MWFRIASHLGGRTVEEWMQVMSQSEFLRWKDRYTHEPWGVAVDDKRYLNICALLTNILNIWITKGSKVKFKAEEYAVCTSYKMIKDLKSKLYSNLKRPWESDLSQEELARQGQALFNSLKAKTGN